jgi:hypothetical protein
MDCASDWRHFFHHLLKTGSGFVSPSHKIERFRLNRKNPGLFGLISVEQFLSYLPPLFYFGLAQHEMHGIAQILPDFMFFCSLTPEN